MKHVEPVLTWTGGKVRLRETLLKRCPHECSTYYEPFLGGGTLYFALGGQRRFKRAVISDWNGELVIMYRAIRDRLKDLILELETLKAHYRIDKRRAWTHQRDVDPYRLTEIQQAARTIFLNATSFSHTYKVNSSGKYAGTFADADFSQFIIRRDRLECASNVLNINTMIAHNDFEAVLKHAVRGDFVYLDPPYVPASLTANFSGYRSGGFNTNEQYRLLASFQDLAHRGVACVLSNSDVDFIHSIYRDYSIERVKVSRRVNCHKSEKAQVIYETLITANL